MSVLASASTESELVRRGRARWTEYQKSNDVSGLKGKVAAIEPESGGVRIADDVLEVLDKMAGDGIDAPAYFVRVGYDYLYVKGRR
jgi:hypothetical protein